MSSSYSSGGSSRSSTSSTSTTNQNRSRTQSQSQTPKSQTKQSFTFAYPPPQKHPQCLRRFSPRLLLQIQQLYTTSTISSKKNNKKKTKVNGQRQRHIPILEIWQPSIFSNRVVKSRPKLGSRDVYVTQCEGFLHLQEESGDVMGQLNPGRLGTVGKGGDEDANPDKNVVSVISHDHRLDEDQKPDPNNSRFGTRSLLYFTTDDLDWEATVLSSRLYRVGFRDRTLEWEKGQDRFTLRIGDLRRSWVLASMTGTSIEIDTGNWDQSVREYFLGGLVSPASGDVDADGRLCTLILSSGAWVAGQEGWFN